MIESFENYTPEIDNAAWVHSLAHVSGHVRIGARSSVWPMAVIRGDVNQIIIGEENSIQDGAVLHCTHDGPYTPGGASLQIGNGNTIGHHVNLHGCQIEDYCLVGIGSIVLDKAVLPSFTMIGAGSLVPSGKVLESGYLYIGAPVKKLRPITEQEREFLSYSAKHYVRLMKRWNKEE